ncbi:MAG: hypothetical protein ACRDRP_25935 [Pseudonocardiaceae bacterium]
MGTLPPKVTALPGSFPGHAEISPEWISLLEAGVIMLNHVTPDDRRMAGSSELSQRLEAVRRGNYIALEPQAGTSTGCPSLRSIPYALDKIVALPARALDAGPPWLQRYRGAGPGGGQGGE